MKLFLPLVFLALLFPACQSSPESTEEEMTSEEKTEIEKVDSMRRTDKESEDSVLAHWEKKMRESKVEDKE